MKLEIIVLDKKVQKFKKSVVKQARRLRRFLPKKGSAEIYLISSNRMRRLNKRFRGKDKTTTVLSFVKPKDFPGPVQGEVYLDPIFIQKNKQNLTQMLVHGVLHILGYDHKRKSDRLIMEKKEAELLARISNN